MAVVKERLVNRGTDSPEDIQRRLDTAKKELKCIPDYEYLVVNDDLGQAVNDVMAIIRAEENRSTRYQNPMQGFLEQEN
jgi:guanylate kinase